MSVVWTYGVETGRLTAEEFVAVTSTNSARILNMHPRKGAIAVGADADIVVWDPKAGKTITAAHQKSAIDYNVFEGVKVKRDGALHAVARRGDLVGGRERRSGAGARQVHRAAPFPAVQRRFRSGRS